MRTTFTIFALAGWMLCGTANGQECEQTIEGNDALRFNLTEVRVSTSCEQVTITLQHVGSLPANVMGHNWVLTTTTNFVPVVTAGRAAGPPGYMPEGDPRVIAETDLIGGGETASVTFDLSGLEPGGDYTYFCSFPGHYVLMKGNFIIE
ncbi:MAG: azurin [Candidatus Rariloculaceae bacterium]